MAGQRGQRRIRSFARGAKWSYYKGNDHPSGGDLEWAEPDFDDSDWPSGASPIRYGDGNGGTVLGDMRNTYSTMFFRRTFTVANPAQISALDLLVDYDDGFVVWINGEQVLDVGGSADSVARLVREHQPRVRQRRDVRPGQSRASFSSMA